MPTPHHAAHRLLLMWASITITACNAFLFLMAGQLDLGVCKWQVSTSLATAGSFAGLLQASQIKSRRSQWG